MPSSSKNLKNIHGDLTLTITLTLTTMVRNSPLFNYCIGFQRFSLFCKDWPARAGGRCTAADANLFARCRQANVGTSVTNTDALQKRCFRGFCLYFHLWYKNKNLQKSDKKIINNGIQRDRVIKLYLTLSKSKYNNLVSAFSSSFERGEKPCL